MLGFVVSAAVSPWVEKVEFVDAVEALAYVQAFRGYNLIKQRSVYNFHCERGS